MPPRQRRSEHPTPRCRATIDHGTIVTLTEWAPWLVEDGPDRALLDDVTERGIVLADLTIVAGEHGRELIVRFIPDQAGTDEAADALLDWAATVGHRRVWLPDRVVDVADALVPAEPVQSTCRNCYTTWEDSSPDFWLLVRRAGRFRSICRVCGHSLAEWLVPDYQHFELPADLDDLLHRSRGCNSARTLAQAPGSNCGASPGPAVGRLIASHDATCSPRRDGVHAGGRWCRSQDEKRKGQTERDSRWRHRL